MAGWWRSRHERPYSSGRTWQQHARDTSWAKEGWYGDTRYARSTVQWAGPATEWHASGWHDGWTGALQAESPPSPESVAHEPDQYPWTCQVPHDVHYNPGGSDGDASPQFEAAHDPPVADGASAPSRDDPDRGAPPQTHKGEKEELEGLHAEAVRRFRLAQPSPDSENDEANCDGASITEEDPVDPDIGTYDPKTGGVWCKVCDRPQNSKGQFRDHLKGQKHKKKYERQQKLKAQEEAEAARSSLASPFQ